MKPTDILVEEHRVIEQVIGCLEKIAGELRSSGRLDLNDAIDAIDFIRNFADGIHHFKEEDVLFTMMHGKGFPKESGPVAVMLMDHDQGRAHVWAMADAAEAASKGDENAKSAFISNAFGYAGLLREHIMKEDNILYPMANNLFDDDDQQALASGFVEAEKKNVLPGSREKYLAMANRLGEKYCIPRPLTIEAGQTGGFCCHY